MKRPIKSFEADEDVRRMLDRAARDGMKLGKVCNEAVRVFLHEKGYARKKDVTEPREGE